MKRINRHIITALAAICALTASAQVKVTAKLDSVDALQGTLRRVDVEVIQPAGRNLRWLTDPREQGQIVELIPGVEVNSASAVDTTDLGNNRLQLTRTLLIQPWDSGEFVIPGIMLVEGTDTFASDRLALKVYTADVDSMTTIHSWGPAVTQPRKFFDWVPDWIADYWWAYLLGLLVIAAGIAAYIIKKKGGLKTIAAPESKPLPPYERAVHQLELLKSRQLCEKGQEKEYYTQLTEILRQYLEGRFGINAMEMTTTQIKRAVRSTLPTDTAPTLMNQVLEMADYVKFAKLRPLPEDNQRAYAQAMAFVEDTKPAPASEPGKEASK